VSDKRTANAVDRRLGQRVRARRLELGMSQERLAELLGVTFQQVQKYEMGVNRIAASRLYDIARALDLPVARFFEGLSQACAGGEAEREVVGDALATPEGVGLLALFGSIKSVKQRRRVLDLVRALAAEESS
jgi:transcriptional regulator with XRE-family HTH domain